MPHVQPNFWATSGASGTGLKFDLKWMHSCHSISTKKLPWTTEYVSVVCVVKVSKAIVTIATSR